MPWRNDAADEIKVDMLNRVAEDFAQEAAKALANTDCPQHPEYISEVTIIPDRSRTLVLKMKFCCPEFEQKISVKLER